ncbi:MAG: sulfotransferase [Kiloniellales bacterium]|nr:sulfotransferase [Kiloniellales bacterium]
MKTPLHQIARQLRARPKDTALRQHYGLLLLQAGRYKEAASELKQVLLKQPGEPQVLNGLALAHRGLGDYGKAREFADGALAAAPDNAELLANKASILSRSGHLEEALRLYRRAIALEPRLTGAHLGIANIASSKGDVERAARAYKQALELQPLNAHAFYGLALLVKAGRFQIPKPIIRNFKKALSENVLPGPSAILAHAALGQIADRDKRHAEAFSHFKAFNDLSLRMKRPKDQAGEDTKLSSFADVLEGLSGRWPQLPLERKAPVPIFVVAMPRSGTTLVEQILLQENSVASCGESLNLHDLSRNIPGYPSGLLSLSDEDLRTLRKSYWDNVPVPAGSAFLIEKLPANFLHLGLIRAILPEARVVHLRRDPRDTCLSCYAHNFAEGHSFSHDLEELGRYYLAYLRIMDFWREREILAVHEIRYESLVAAPEDEIKVLCHFLGLRWHEDFLRFHETGRAVATASNLQVREPVTSKAVGRWRSYEAELAPLSEVLSGVL